MTGYHVAPGTSRTFCLGAEVDCFIVQSDILPSAASPTPSPTPAPTAVPTATPKPTLKATPTLAPGTARPTGTPVGTVAAATPTAAATATESGTAGQSAGATPTETDTPEQSVAGATFVPGQSDAPGALEPGDGGWAGSVATVGQVSTDGGTIGVSALAALLLLILMGFVGELFNNTMETNYDRIVSWWSTSWLGRIGRRFSGFFGGGT